MRKTLFRIAVLFTGFYFAVGLALAFVSAQTPGTGWMHFSLSQFLSIYLGLFSVPMTLLMWVGWAVLRCPKWPHSSLILTAHGILAPLLYALILYFAR